MAAIFLGLNVLMVDTSFILFVGVGSVVADEPIQPVRVARPLQPRSRHPGRGRHI